MREFRIYRNGDSALNFPYTIEADGHIAQVAQTKWGARLWVRIHGKNWRKFSREEPVCTVKVDDA